MTSEPAGAPADESAPTRRFERRAMGSPLRLTLVDSGGPTLAGGSGSLLTRSLDDREALAGAAWSAVSGEFEAAEQAMSRFRETSDLSAINRLAGTGRAIAVDRRLVRALAASDRAGRVTVGRFDARVLGDLERLGYRGAALDGDPGAGAGDERAATAGDPRPTKGGAGSGGRWLTVDPRDGRVAVDRPVDLGGIGKGLALRWAWRALQASGWLAVGTGALLEAGGDLVAGGPSPDAGPWLVGIEDPLARQEHLAVLEVGEGAVATSSTAIHRWTDDGGRVVHHLIDPRTGEPGGDGLASVTVAGPDPAWAEIWSKSLFLAGARGIADLARGRGLSAWWVGQDGTLEMTPGARARTAWVSGEDEA